MAIVVPASTSPFKKRKLISPTFMQKNVEERLAAEKAKEEQKATEEERLAAEKAKEMFFMWKKAEEEKKATEATAAAEKDEEMQLFVDGLFDEMEQIVEVPVPMTQEEIFMHEANINQQGPRAGIASPLSPDIRSFFLDVWELAFPSTIWVQI